MTTTNKSKVTLGMCNMNVEVSRKLLKDNKYGDIQYLSFCFYQQSDTAGITEVTINSVTKKEVMALAKNIKQLAESFT